MSDTTFPLSKPITAHDEELTALTLRKLGPADARAVRALPYHIASDESVHIDPEAAAKYIVRMARIPMSSVDQLELSDFNGLAWMVAGFFLNQGSGPTTSSEGSSTTLPTSGA
ncbi:phage tail assembly protein [Achromobacter xylosoxidans]|uniref:Phage tail assembly protein n=1 Tax=Alcaligenes xylosoxydans xylosoxydans TaxID=85698 RepID=A0A1R1JMA5_ALCXX|nr:phage tail assembly protein [Achromobacter xylosoxidans]OMG79347.1 hypothetical protein BIZ92_15235 [Achromobacter xylosoxidans]